MRDGTTRGVTLRTNASAACLGEAGKDGARVAILHRVVRAILEQRSEGNEIIKPYLGSTFQAKGMPDAKSLLS